jgi:MFS family permease
MSATILVQSLVFMAPFVSTAKAATNTDSFAFLTNTQITDTTTGEIFIDHNVSNGDQENTFALQGNPGCITNSAVKYGSANLGKPSIGSSPVALIDFGNTPSGTQDVTGTYYAVVPDTSTAQNQSGMLCKTENRGDVVVKNNGGLSSSYKYIDTNTITGNGNDTRTFTVLKTGTSTYTNLVKVSGGANNSVIYADVSTPCLSFVVLGVVSQTPFSVNPASGKLYNYTQTSGGECQLSVASSACVSGRCPYTPGKKFENPKPITIANAGVFNLATVTAADNPKASDGTTTGAAGNTTDSPSCYSGIPVFGWLLCPILDLTDGAYSFARTTVQSLLYINDSAFSPELKSSWSAVRNFSSLLIVLVALFMVASQIFSFEFMSAYTVKKVLPRLVIAAILIQLSWFIFTTLIVITNAVGIGLYSLLTSPFGGGGDIMNLTGIINAKAPTAVALANTGIFASIIAAGFIGLAALATPGALLTLCFTAIGVLISILVVLFTLIIRKVLIIVLLTLAPLALVAWILPNTKRYWDMWWQLFSKLLLMFPLIMLLFAAGTIGASILSNQGTVSAIDYIIVIIAYFAPLFLIPATFKFAGGMFTTAVSAINKAGGRAKGFGYFGAKARAKESYTENRKEKGIELANTTGPGFRGSLDRRRGRIMAGTAGASGSYANRLRASEEQAYIKNASLEYEDKTKGMEFPAQVTSSTEIASAKLGSTVELKNAKGVGTGKFIKVSEGMQRVATKFLADTGRSDSLRQVENAMRANNQGVLWNTIVGENAGSIGKVNPDQVGKNFETLSALEMSDLKPETLRNMRAKMADQSIDPVTNKPNVSLEAKEIIANRLDELMANETLRIKLGADALAHVNEMRAGVTRDQATNKVTSVTVNRVTDTDTMGRVKGGTKPADANFDPASNGWKM